MEQTKRDEVKVMIGINDNNEVVPLGAWCSESWKTVENLIHKANTLIKNWLLRSLQTCLLPMARLGFVMINL